MLSPLDSKIFGSKRGDEMAERLVEVRNLKSYFHTEDGVVPAVDGVSMHIFRECRGPVFSARDYSMAAAPLGRHLVPEKAGDHPRQ